MNSTVAARLNGYLAQKGPYEALKTELANLLPPPRKAKSCWILSGAIDRSAQASRGLKVQGLFQEAVQAGANLD